MGDCSPAVSMTLHIVEVAGLEPALMVRIVMCLFLSIPACCSWKWGRSFIIKALPYRLSPPILQVLFPCEPSVYEACPLPWLSFIYRTFFSKLTYSHEPVSKTRIMCKKKYKSTFFRAYVRDSNPFPVLSGALKNLRLSQEAGMNT